jgi:uncharacterized protein (DUF488 family)
MKLYTVGVSQKSAEEFFGICRGAGIEKIIDVRLNNKSQLLGFSKGRDLQYFCEKCHGIGYEHAAELAPSEGLLKKYQQDKDWDYYVEEFGRILEERPTVENFGKACREVKNVCLLCSEPTAEKCHRRLLAEYLVRQLDDLEIIHL